MSDNYNMNPNETPNNFVGGVNPTTGQNMGDLMIANQLKQQEQAQLVAQAIEKSKQMGMQSDVDAEGGLEAEKGLVPKAEALTTLKAAAETSNLEDAQKAAIMQDAKDNWPEVVNQDTVHRAVTALHVAKAGKLGEGAAFPADGTQKDENEVAYPKGTMIQEIEDTDGNHSYVRSNSPPSVLTGGAGDAAIQKSKTALVNQLVKLLAATRGNWLSQGLYRCSVALQKLNDTAFLTKQDLAQVGQDVAAIFTGGVPSEDEILKTEYGTKINDVLGHIGRYSGHVFGLPLAEIRAKLVSVIQPLYDEMIHRYTSLMDLAAQGHLDALQADPQWWIDTKEKAIAAAEHKHNAVLALPSGNVLPMGNSNAPAAPSGNTTSAPAADPLGIL